MVFLFVFLGFPGKPSMEGGVTTPCAPADIAVAMRGLQATVGMTSVIDGLIIHTWGGVEYKGPVDTCLFLSLSLELTMSAYRRQTPRHVAL